MGLGVEMTVHSLKGKHSRELPSDMSLPDELNRFEASNTEACRRANQLFRTTVIMLSVADVSKTF